MPKKRKLVVKAEVEFEFDNYPESGLDDAMKEVDKLIEARDKFGYRSPFDEARYQKILRVTDAVWIEQKDPNECNYCGKVRLDRFKEPDGKIICWPCLAPKTGGCVKLPISLD